MYFSDTLPPIYWLCVPSINQLSKEGSGLMYWNQWTRKFLHQPASAGDVSSSQSFMMRFSDLLLVLLNGGAGFSLTGPAGVTGAVLQTASWGAGLCRFLLLCLGCLRTSLTGLFPIAISPEITWPRPANSCPAQPSCPTQSVHSIHVMVASLFNKRQITRDKFTVTRI